MSKKRKNMTDNRKALVAALKKDLGKEAMSATTFAGLLRGGVKKVKAPRKVEAIREKVQSAYHFRALEAAPAAAPTDSADMWVPVVLICEGLGNARDMNYYGPEAIASAVNVFEGKPCFLDHPTESENEQIPERRVECKVGYYKDLKVEKVVSPEGQKVDGCVGRLYFEMTESGREAYGKALTAIEYRKQFPKSKTEYVGVSVNADAEAEDGTVTVNGETVECNYVHSFVDSINTSVDMVTSPARGGRFLARESQAGGKLPSKEEDRMKLLESLKTAANAVKEAAGEKDPAKKDKKVSEAEKLLAALYEDGVKAVKEAEAEGEAEAKKKESEGESAEAEAEGFLPPKQKEGESAEAYEARKHEAFAKAAAGMGYDLAKKKTEGEGEADPPPLGKKSEADDKGGKKAAAKDPADDGDDDAMESRRLAVRHMCAEAGVDLEFVDVEGLAKLKISEAKKQIANVKKVQEAA